MEEHSEVKSENARNVILSYRDTVYYVNKVNVQFQEGADMLKAVFHARKLRDKQFQDLEVEISQATYRMLIEYAKLDNFDLILVLRIEGNESKWCLISEEWLKKQIKENGKAFYIV
ncbi:MAG: hypothetical protein NWE99_05330 [Candidatus Bathyarchaeota archaeon]|nr:hypothetical protein [Candidatus Bathyarchaeota archaeon]